MRRRIFPASLLCVALAGVSASAQAGAQTQQPPPNPTVDDSKTPATAAPKKVEATNNPPAQSLTRAPLKRKARHKRHRHRRAKSRS